MGLSDSRHIRSPQINALLEEDVCSSCGRFSVLDPFTGWCPDCSKAVDIVRCSSCGGLVKKEPRQHRTICSSCRREQWLGAHADTIEEFMAKGHTFAESIELVYKSNRPHCLVCNREIKGGTKGRTLFCSRTKECRRASRSFRWHKDKGESPDVALRHALKGKIEWELLQNLSTL